MVHNFTVEQKRRLCELLNGMDRAVSLDDVKLFDRLKNRYHVKLCEFLEIRVDDAGPHSRFRYDLASNAYANTMMFLHFGLLDKSKNELEKARTLKNKYFFY